MVCPNMAKGQVWLGANKNYYFKCPTHGAYLQKFNSVQQRGGHRCQKCAGRYGQNKLTLEEAELLFSDMKKGQVWTNTGGSYLFECRIHGLYRQNFRGHLVGKRCQKCRDEKSALRCRRSHEEFIADLKRVNSEIKVLGLYKNSQTNLLYECLKCGFRWETTPNSLLNGKTGCSRCTGLNKKTHDEFIDLLKKKNSNIKVLGEFKGSRFKVSCHCLKCGYGADGRWLVQAGSLILSKPTGCPWCRRSISEEKTASLLKKKGLSYVQQKRFDSCRNKRPLPFDFYLPDYNILIENQGIGHYIPVRQWGGLKTFELRQKADKIKLFWARHNGFQLIRISYHIKNVEAYLEKRLAALLPDTP